MADWSEKWYKEKFQDMEAEPSSQSWEEISAQMDEWPSHWYKSNVEDLKLKPKADLWDRISAEIIPPSVGISFNTGFYLRSIAIIFIFLIIPFTITQWESKNSNEYTQLNEQSEVKNRNLLSSKNSTKNSEKTASTKNKLNDENKSSSNQNTYSNISENTANNKTTSSDKNIFESKSNQVKNTAPSAKDNQIQNSNNNEIISQISKTETIAKGIQSHVQNKNVNQFNTLYAIPLNQNTIQKSFTKTIIEIPEKKYRPSNNWMIGAQLRPQISTLINPITLSAMRGSENIHMTPGANVTYALVLSRKLNNYNFIDVGVEMNNKRTHRYTKSTFDTENDKILDLNYLTLEVTHRKKSKSIFKQNPRLSFSTIKGIYGSYLVASNEIKNIDGGIELKEGFRNFDLGISLGLEVSMHVQPDAVIYSGIKTQVGAIGIFKGTELVPEDFFFNSTSSTGIFIGFRKFF